MTPRTWTPDELRLAIWLGYGGTSPTRPATSAAAAAAGVSARTIQRWLAGASIPSIEHATQLRAALSPEPKALLSQAMQANHFRIAATELERPRTRAASSQWRAQRWHEPHTLWLLHHETLGVCRTMLTRAQPARPVEIPHGWTLLDRHTYPNRPRAGLAKHSLLERVEPWRIRIRDDLIAPGLVEAGRDETWLDTAPIRALLEGPSAE